MKAFNSIGRRKMARLSLPKAILHFGQLSFPACCSLQRGKESRSLEIGERTRATRLVDKTSQNSRGQIFKRKAPSRLNGKSCTVKDAHLARNSDPKLLGHRSTAEPLYYSKVWLRCERVLFLESLFNFVLGLFSRTKSRGWSIARSSGR